MISGSLETEVVHKGCMLPRFGAMYEAASLPCRLMSACFFCKWCSSIRTATCQAVLARGSGLPVKKGGGKGGLGFGYTVCPTLAYITMISHFQSTRHCSLALLQVRNRRCTVLSTQSVSGAWILYWSVVHKPCIVTLGRHILCLHSLLLLQCKEYQAGLLCL